MRFAALALIACLPAAAIARQADQHAARSRALGSVDADLPVRAAAFADAMTGLATRFPDDHEAAAFASLANMVAYFESPAAERVKYSQPVRQHALRAFRANPRHPGAAHYLIHFVDKLLGDYLLAAGRKAEAADAYQKALERRPNRLLAKRGLEAARR